MCFKEYKNFNLIIPLVTDNRCSIRYNSLTIAKISCMLMNDCAGIVDDSGLNCESINKQFELRTNSTMEMNSETTTWLKVSCQESHAFLIATLILLGLLIVSLIGRNKWYNQNRINSENSKVDEIALTLQQPPIRRRPSLEIL